jgi:3-hydroxyacyl-[acyl-carrier-protein] dehydratase
VSKATSVSSATWTVPVDHPAFAGHFPGRPIVPGVVLLDQALRHVALASGLAMAGWSVANAKFLSPVGPGAMLTFSWQARPSGAFEFTVASEDRPVASGLLAPLGRT